jgi:prepilin-type N-terminal cleavage/methylation domain-containing protein
MTAARNEHGFTLIEVLVALVIMFIVFGATLTVLDVFQRNSRTDQLRSENQDDARNAIDRLSRELRNVAAPSTKAAGALELAESYSVTFETVDPSKTVAPGENASDAMRVRYCLNDSTPTNEVLWRQYKRWESAEAPTVPTNPTCPDPSAAHWEGSTRLVEHITNRNGGQNRAVFSYGPPSASVVSQIVSIQPTLYLDPQPGSRPGETQLTSSISLRNENRPPTANFSAVQLGASRKVAINASESTDPDGLALTYKWWDNSTREFTTAQQWETKELVEGSSHTFKLEVTDPGGLSSNTERTLVIK